MKLPTVLLINGLLMYQPAAVTPLAPLAEELRAAGFRVVIDNHLQTWHADEEPVAVVGHSRGGWTAFMVQKRQQQNARVIPYVITFDAAPAGPCPVPGMCLNIHSDYYHKVPGAENIAISRQAGFPVLHSLIPYTDAAKRIVLERLAPFATPAGTDETAVASHPQNEPNIGDMNMTELIAHVSREPLPPKPAAFSENHSKQR